MSNSHCDDLKKNQKNKFFIIENNIKINYSLDPAAVDISNPP